MTAEPANPTPERSYVIVITARDEAKYLQGTIDSIAGQTLLPVELVIVDDGSKDETGAIADAAAAQYPWVHVVHRPDRGERKVGAGVVETFYAGYEALQTRSFAYQCKLDGDLTLPPGYFEGIVKKMEADATLGGASGKVFNPVGEGAFKEERIIDDMVSGAVNFWRRACWEQIGGYVRMVMWDGIAMHRARMFGWHTRSFRDKDLEIIHHRLMGSSHKNILHGRMRWGRGQWFMGCHPLYIIASGINRMFERPYIVGGICIMAGYFSSMIKGAEQYDDPEFRKYLHAWQLKRLGLAFLAPEVTPHERNAS
ncbi:MAG TPA: glycosyltransferase [Candidatus Hydrogenedentes bacterium]|nr:glycosyltransferase [Candidatus Hydrogenedentota bacterium]HQE84033.1 glycosyltransferase [Candidatus Hydrogenedentota bacterium]HQH53430.1 glycosyltransferase [Candidatus Hydrogenedentota bacterium]HQM50055.1 glycosyltransferase [Candidatus Hydrogenedentota bacterium]